MSAVIQTTTPFVIEEVLITALTILETNPLLITAKNVHQYTHRGGIQVGDIVLNRTDYYGPQHFRKVGTQYQLRHDSSEMSGRVISQVMTKPYKKVAQFLRDVEQQYQSAYVEYQLHLEEQERQRLEAERQARVEATRKRVIEKAKAQGYSIKEVTKNGKIQLVLRRSI